MLPDVAQGTLLLARTPAPAVLIIGSGDRDFLPLVRPTNASPKRQSGYSARGKRNIRATQESGRGSRFNNEADAAAHEGESLGHYGMATTVILPLFFFGEPSGLSRRPCRLCEIDVWT